MAKKPKARTHTTMQTTLKPALKRRFLSSIIAGLGFVVVAVPLSMLVLFLLKTQYIAYQAASVPLQTATQEPEPFPLGVNPTIRAIEENPAADLYLTNHVAPEMLLSRKERRSWFARVFQKLAAHAWYQNLASAGSRVLVIRSGERKEEIADNFGDILGWSEEERELFLRTVETTKPVVADGKFFPMTYLVARGTSPRGMASLVLARFKDEILSRYSDDIAEVVPIEEALTVASLLERESYEIEEMRHIAGIIWNRQFIGMPLQIDATLQYAKANERGGAWWPPVHPRDKFISSPFNTYENEGLPPSPIANPSIEAIFAALNPRETECLFYFHDNNGTFHCTPTYEEHVALLKQHYGRGR